MPRPPFLHYIMAMENNVEMMDDTHPILRSGVLTLEKAKEGMEALAASLNGQFVDAVERIGAAKGRLIVTGMGKSGHIARKIAATFASTGTPSHFVHPAEASHGDMGMIVEGDILLMLSNSGETTELGEMIAYAKRFGIPIIALVRRQKSMLVEMADIPIVLPEIPEVSVTGAPTTSTTMMLVYGDALAMAVLEQRGFTREDFHHFHPGGKLGQGLLRVSQLMHRQEGLPLVAATAPMSGALVEMTAKALGCAIVVGEAGQLLGIVTDGDLRRHMKDRLMEKTARDIMTSDPVTTTPQALATEALGVMNARSITGLVVQEQDIPVGFLHIHDCLRAGIA